MANKTITYHCSKCGYASDKDFIKCPACECGDGKGFTYKEPVLKHPLRYKK